MYVNSIYKFHHKTKEVENKEGLSLQDCINSFAITEQCLRFSNDEELKAHINDKKKFFLSDNANTTCKTEVVEITPEEYLKSRRYILEYRVFKRYANSLGITFNSDMDEIKYLRDKDFLSKAYDYALDSLENEADDERQIIN